MAAKIFMNYRFRSAWAVIEKEKIFVVSKMVSLFFNLLCNILNKLIIIHILRLAPVYLVIIGIAEIVFGWFKINSSYISTEDPHYYCHDNWWRNLLFINNFFNWHEAVTILIFYYH